MILSTSAKSPQHRLEAIRKKFTMSERPQQIHDRPIWPANRPPAFQISTETFSSSTDSMPTVLRGDHSEPEVGPRDAGMRYLEPSTATGGLSEPLIDSHCSDESENLNLHLSQTQQLEPRPGQQDLFALRLTYQKLTPHEDLTIWGPSHQPECHHPVRMLNKFQNDDWEEYVVFHKLDGSSPPKTMKLSEILHIKVHVRNPEEEEIHQQNLQMDSETQELYPNLQPQWKDLGIPLTPNGNVDSLHLHALYHYRKQQFESVEEFRIRIGVTPYLQNRHVSEESPQIWNQVACVLNDKCQEIRTIWFNTFPDHQKSFPEWWLTIGTNLPWMKWSNGQVHTYGHEMTQRLQNLDGNARALINQAPLQLRNKLTSLYGAYTLTVGNQHLSTFEDFINLDEEYVQMKKALTENAPLPKPTSQPLELDDWQLYTSSQWEVNQQTMPMFLKKRNPTSLHIEKLILTDTIYAQSIMDPNCKIEVADFLPGGRLCHVFIPNYVYVPPMAAQILTGVRNIQTKDLHLLWRRMFLAKTQAATLTNMSDPWSDSDVPDPLPELVTPWRTEIQNAKTTEFPLHNLDEIQHVHAHKFIATEEARQRRYDRSMMNDLYDMLVRPMERMFTCDMPLSEHLLNSQHDVVKQKWLFSTITKMCGHFKWPRQSTIFILKELSKIRILHQHSLVEKFSQDWNAVSRKNCMFFAALPSTEDMFDHEELNLNVLIDDFYPGGKLYGIHVRADQPLPAHIVHRFTTEHLTHEQIKKLHNDIIIMRAQWGNQVHTQLAIQNGKAPLLAPEKMPPWLHHIDLMTDIHKKKVKQMTPAHLEETLQSMDLSVTDFLKQGRLQNYPTQGGRTLPLEVQKSLGLPDELTKKDLNSILVFINKFIRTHHDQIVQGRHIDRNTFSSTSSSPEDSPPQTSGYNPLGKRGRPPKPTAPPVPEINIHRPPPPVPPVNKLSLSRRPPKRMEPNTSSSQHTSQSSTTDTSSPPQNWLKKEKELKLGQPPPTGPPPAMKSLFPTEQLFRPIVQIPENPFLWNGQPKTAPKWAMEKVSADTLHAMKDNRTPIAHKARLVVEMGHRQTPLDGVNRIQDLFMNKCGEDPNDIRDFGVEIISVSKERGDESTQSETRTMNVPFLDSEHFKTILLDAGRAILPPAITDVNRDDTPLASFESVATHFTYRAEIVVINAKHGTERILAISQQNYETKFFAGFSIPWRFTSLFLIKFTSIQSETAYIQNEKHQTAKGNIPAPNLERMNRKHLLEAETNGIHFVEM